MSQPPAATTPAPDGIVVVDKPSGWTSHDVVARVRRLAGTRRVGHAGTLDPMATGVLVVGIGRATRLLGHLALSAKEYRAVARLGVDTSTDDAEGEPGPARSIEHITLNDIRREAEALTGRISQVPPQVSAIKVAGRRAYAMARAGETVELKPREVTVHRLDVGVVRPGDGVLDVVLDVECSSGTYIRSLARDLGAALACGGHLVELRRTRVGSFTLDVARTLDQLAEAFTVVPLASAVAESFPRRVVDEEWAVKVAHGARLPAAGLGPGPVGVFGPDGDVLALVEEVSGTARPLCVFAGG